MDSSSRSGPLSRTDVASWPAFPCADAQQYIHAACFQQRRAYAALISARRSSATTTTTTTTQRQRQRRLHQQTNTTHVAPSLPPPFPPLPGSSSEDLEPLGPQCKRPIISTNSLDFLDAPEALEASYRGHAIIRTVAWWIATSLSCHGSTEPLPPLVSGAVRQLRVSQPGAPGRRPACFQSMCCLVCCFMLEANVVECTWSCRRAFLGMAPIGTCWARSPRVEGARCHQ